MVDFASRFSGRVGGPGVTFCHVLVDSASPFLVDAANGITAKLLV